MADKPKRQVYGTSQPNVATAIYRGPCHDHICQHNGYPLCWYIYIYIGTKVIFATILPKFLTDDFFVVIFFFWQHTYPFEQNRKKKYFIYSLFIFFFFCITFNTERIPLTRTSKSNFNNPLNWSKMDVHSWILFSHGTPCNEKKQQNCKPAHHRHPTVDGATVLLIHETYWITIFKNIKSGYDWNVNFFKRT